MTKSYLLVTFRKLKNFNSSLAISVSSLALGITCCLFIFQYCYYELSYDKELSDKEIFRLETLLNNDKGQTDAFSSFSDINNIISATNEQFDFIRLVPFSNSKNALLINRKADGAANRIFIENVYVADQNVFQFLNIEFTEFKLNDVQENLIPIYLSKNELEKYFIDYERDQEAGNKLEEAVNNNFKKKFYIAGVFTPLPSQSHLRIDALVIPNDFENYISNPESDAYTYIKSPSSTFESGLIKHTIRDIGEIHLSSLVSNNPEPGNSKKQIVFLLSLGLMVLLLSSSSYVNSQLLSSFDRSKELGIRKLLGIRRRSLFIAMFLETLLLNFIASAFGILIFVLVSKFIDVQFPKLLDLKLVPIIADSIQIHLLFISLISIVSSLISTLYPALYYAVVSPIILLKSKLENLKNSWLPNSHSVVKSILVFQVSCSVAILSGLFILYKQYSYQDQMGLKPYDLSVNGVFPGSSGANLRFTENLFSVIERLKNDQLIDEITFSNLENGVVKTALEIAIIKSDTLTLTDSSNVQFTVVDPKFLSVRHTSFAFEDDFARFGSNSREVIINQATLEILPLMDEKQIPERILTSLGPFTVKSVVDDQIQKPTIYSSGFEYRTFITIDGYYPGGKDYSVGRYVHDLEVAFSSVLPYFSLYSEDYESNDQFRNVLFYVFVALALFSSFLCLMGIYGLSNYISQQKAKEIGIRKILGGNLIQLGIVYLKEFIFVLSIGLCIAIPLTYFTAQIWLEEFIYRINMSPMLFLVPVSLLVLLIILVIGNKCWKTLNTDLTRL